MAENFSYEVQSCKYVITEMCTETWYVAISAGKRLSISICQIHGIVFLKHIIKTRV